MSVKDSAYDPNGLSLASENVKLIIQAENRIEKIILNFIDNPPNIPRRRYVIARNQMLSLYRRMKYHPENIALCKFYENRIRQIIQLEKGKVK